MKMRLIAAVAMLLLAGAGGYSLWTHPELLGRPRATAEEAAEIKSAIERWFVDVKADYDDAMFLTYDGDVIVEPDGAGYRIVIPPAYAVRADGTDTRGSLGPVNMRIEPRSDGDLDVAWSVGPGEFKLERWSYPTSPDGTLQTWNGTAQTWTLTVQGSEGKGVIDGRYHWVSELSAQVGPIVFTPADPEQGPTVTLSGMTLGVDSAEPEPGMLDAKAEVALTDIKATILGALPVGSIGELKLTASLRKLDLAAFTSWTEAISQARQRFKATDGDRDRRAEQREAAELLLSALRLLDGAGFRYEVSDVSVPIAAASLDSAQFGLELKDGRSDAPDLRLALDLSGYKSRMPLPLVGMFDNALAATDLHVDIGLVDLPKARFAEEIRKAAALGRNVEPVDSVPTDFDFAGFALTSGVYLDVASVRFGSDLYRVDMTGEIRPESASPNSATAKLALVVEGFDEVIRSLRSPRNLGGEFSFEAMFSLEFADRLAEMQALGAETVGEDGRKLWRYDLLATPDGAITLNGKDARPILGIP